MEKAIEIKNLSYTYPDGTGALKDVNITIDNGEIVGLLGPNGAGKSTLILHLNGTLNGNGQIRVLGLEFSRENLREIRRLVGLVFQDPDDQLFLSTVFDDVAFGPLNMGLSPQEAGERVKDALFQVGMEEVVSKSSHHLSLGEKKRVAIATVLATQPEILVMDEPTSNLDPRTRRNLIGLLKNLPQTKIIATHDMNLAWELCRRAIIMDEGSVVADGIREQVLCNEELLLQYGLELPTNM